MPLSSIADQYAIKTSRAYLPVCPLQRANEVPLSFLPHVPHTRSCSCRDHHEQSGPRVPYGRVLRRYRDDALRKLLPVLLLQLCQEHPLIQLRGINLSGLWDRRLLLHWSHERLGLFPPRTGLVEDNHLRLHLCLRLRYRFLRLLLWKRHLRNDVLPGNLRLWQRNNSNRLHDAHEAATVAIQEIPVVALFPAFLLSVATDSKPEDLRLHFAEQAAAVPGNRVTVITVFRQFPRAIAANALQENESAVLSAVVATVTVLSRIYGSVPAGRE